MTALRTQLENAVVSELSPLLQSETDGYFKAVRAYNGDIPPDDPEDDPAFARLVENGTPVCGVTAAGDVSYDSSQMTMTRRYVRGEGSVVVLVVSGNPRSHEAHLRGDDYASDPGLYQIAEDVRDELWGVELGVTGAGLLDPSGESTVRVNERYTALVLSYQIMLDVESVDPEADADAYETIRSTFDEPADEDDAENPIVTQDTDIT